MNTSTDVAVIREEILRERREKMGVLSGVMGSSFALLGIFTVGILFVPIALVCSIVSTIRALIGGSTMGLCVAILSWLLTVIGFAVSPFVWATTVIVIATIFGIR